MKRILFLVLVGVFLCVSGVQAITISTFSSSEFSTDLATLNTNLGLDASYTIEDFEDDILVGGLSVLYADGSTNAQVSTWSDASWNGARIWSLPVST